MGLDLCMKMLALDPARRISMKEALKHPYFNDLTAEEISKYQVNWYQLIWFMINLSLHFLP